MRNLSPYRFARGAELLRHDDIQSPGRAWAVGGGRPWSIHWLSMQSRLVDLEERIMGQDGTRPWTCGARGGRGGSSGFL
jgi:hypothetical protein